MQKAIIQKPLPIAVFAPVLTKAPIQARRQKGFTLIEVMVVIVILAILASVVVPKVVGQSDKARVGTTKTVLSSTSNAIDSFRVDNGRYPTTQEGLNALLTPPQGAKNWPEGGYLKGGFPKDGWDNDLMYAAPGTNGRPYDLFSLGADNKEGGEGNDADLYAKQ